MENPPNYNDDLSSLKPYRRFLLKVVGFIKAIIENIMYFIDIICWPLILIVTGFGLLFGGYTFLRQCYFYVLNDEWVPYSINDLLNWHDPKNWVGLWEIMETLHPLMLVVIGIVIFPALSYINSYIEDLFWLANAALTSDSTNDKPKKNHVRSTLISCLIPPIVIVTFAFILNVVVDKDINTINNIWIYVLAICGIFAIIKLTFEILIDSSNIVDEEVRVDNEPDD